MDTKTTDQATATPQQPNQLGAVAQSLYAEWKSSIITIGITAVVVASFFLYRSNKDGNEATASRMLGEARNLQALQAIQSQYPATSAARLAMLQAAKVRYDQGDFTGAQGAYKDFLTQNPAHPMAGIAELGIIQCTEGMGEYEKALTAFAAFATKHPDHFLAAPALFGKARCQQELKRYAEARATYEDFLAANPKTYWRNDIDEALKQLDRESRKPGVKL